MKLHPLKVERELRGWSQSKVAEMLGTTTRTVIRWEQGEVVPYPYYRERLCTVYGKNAKQLGLVIGESLQQDCFEDQESMPIELELPPELPISFPPPELAQQAFLLDPTIPEMLGRAESLLGRGRLLAQIKDRLLRADNSPSLALNGLPGIGKTALAVALALDEEIQASFQDGILWAELGPQPDVVGQLARWGTLLEISASQVENLHSPEAWGKALQAVIGQRHLLLVIDDAWRAEDAFALRVGGPHCTYLLTTRLPQVALAFAGEKVISVAELEDADGLSLLTRFVPQLVEQDPKGARVLVRAVGGLPLGLTLMGKYLALQALTQQPRRLQAALAQVHNAKQRLHVSVPMAPRERTTNLPPGIPPSLYATIAVSDQQLSPQAHAALCALAAFPPKPSSFSEEEALVVSQQPTEVLDELWDTGLLETYGTGRYTLHQTVVDYARALSEDLADQEPLNDSAGSTHSHKEESKYDTFWRQSLHDVSTGYSRSRLALGSFSQSSGHFVSIIAIGSLCVTLILMLSVFNKLPFASTSLPASSLTVIDDSIQGTGTNVFNYVGTGWHHCTDGCDDDPPDAYNGSNSWNNVPDDYVTISFTGVQIKLYGVLNTRHGRGAISIDGSSEAIVDFYSPREAGNQLLWTSPLLSAGPHTFKLRVTGNKDPVSSNTCIVPDRVDILS
jgi:transcriptional regulator with XRE-family HTH domain